MILFFLLILVVLGIIGFIFLNNYPSFLLNGIFQKCQDGQFSFLQKSFIFLNPRNIDEQPSVAKYFEKLKEYLTEHEGGLKSSFLFKSQVIKSKKDESLTCKVIIRLKFSLAGNTHIEIVEFNFIRYDWWRWTLFDCKELSSDVSSFKYNPIKNGYNV